MADADWRPLHSSNSALPLVARWRFEGDRYTIHVTDLSTMWSETIDLQDIIERARDVASPIHPEDNPSQMKILLEKIEGALLDTVTSERQASGALQLKMTIRLPSGLGDFEWFMRLQQLPPTDLG